MPKLTYEYFKNLEKKKDGWQIDDMRMSKEDDERLQVLQAQYRSKVAAIKEIRDLPSDEITEQKRTTRDGLLNDLYKIVEEIDAFPRIEETSGVYFDGDERNQKNKGAVRKAGDKKDYRSLFCSDGRSLDRGEFKSASEFIEVVGSGLFDPRLKRASMIGGVDSTGGYSVPEQYSAEWLDASLPAEIVRPLAQVWPLSSATRKIPAWDGEDQSAGELFGGFSMQILSEEGTGTKQTGKVRMIKLTAKKGAIFVDISSELEADGLGFEDQLKMALQKSIGYGIDKYCLGGNVPGPQGVFNSPALISVAKESGQSADSIVYENLVNMYARQLNKRDAVWLFNDDAVPQLMGLSIAVGTGGSHVKVMNEKDGKFTIFGNPVFFTPHMPTLGSASDCGFIDFGAYALGMRKEMSIDKSIAPGWTQDLVSYRIIIRFDGQGVLDKPVTPENGATLSPFVTLDERS